MLWLTGLGRLGADNIGTSSQRCRRMLFQRQTDAQQPTANCLTTTRKTNFKTGKSERHRDSRNDTVSCIFYIFHWWNYFELMRKCIVCVTYPFLNWYIPNTICLIRNHLSLFFLLPISFLFDFLFGFVLFFVCPVLHRHCQTHNPIRRHHRETLFTDFMISNTFLR